MAQSDHITTMTLRDYWRILWLRRRLVVAVVVLCTLLALGRALMQPNVYVATASLMYSPPPNVASAATGGSTDLSRLSIDVQNVINTIGSPDVRERASSLLNALDREVSYSVSATVVVPASSSSQNPVADVVAITVAASSPEAAAAIANAYARAIIDLRKEDEQRSWRTAQQIIEGQLGLYKTPESRLTSDYAQLSQQLRNLQIAEASANGDFEVLIPATTPSSPDSPKPVKSALFGMVVGVFLGVVLAFVVEQFDTRVRSHREISRILGLAVIGRVPRMARRAVDRGGLVASTDPEGSVSEALRVLRRNLEWSGIDEPVKSIVLTSLLKGEGKTLTLCNLAVTLARAGSKVIVVDADLRAPQVHRVFGLPNVVGLTSVVLGKTPMEEALRAYRDTRLPTPAVLTRANEASATARVGTWAGTLLILTSGPLPPNPGEVVASNSVAGTLAELATSDADYVLVDTPPMLGFSDAGALAPSVDGVVVVVRIDRARRPVLEEAREALDALPGRKIGLVVVGERVDHTQLARYSDYGAGQ